MGDPIITDFRRLVEVQVEEFVTASKAFGSKHMDTLALIVIRAFEAEFTFVYEGIGRPKPATDEDLRRITAPIFGVLKKFEEFREGNRHVEEYCNHMSTIGESIMALNWITVPRAPAQYVRDMKEAGDYFGNRVLTANKGNELHVTWIKKWNAVLTTLEEYIRRFHPCGFVWNLAASCNRPVSFYFPEVAPPPPPPPSYFGYGDAADAPAPDDPAARIDLRTLQQQLLMKDINQGLGIIGTLKPVSQTARRSTAAPTAQLASARGAQKNAASAPSHPPVFASEGKKWRVEYQKNAKSLNIEPTDKSESLAMYKCESTYLETKAKMNAVTIDNCKKCTVVLQHIISSVELIRCDRVQVHCMGSCPNITLDSCDSVQVFLNDSSANCEVISSKSTSTNICRLTEGDDDYIEFAVPEQIKSVVVDKKLHSSVVDHSM